VGRCVPREPAERLLPLPLRPDRPPAPVLVGEDDCVDEPLEEIALLGCRGAPCELERLVCREPVAG